MGFRGVQDEASDHPEGARQHEEAHQRQAAAAPRLDHPAEDQRTLPPIHCYVGYYRAEQSE